MINDSTLLLIIPNSKEKNINDVKPCSTAEFVENTWITSCTQ